MTEKIFKSALTLTLGFAVCAYAEPFHSEDFSDYADGYSITNAPSWTGGAEDESKVVDADGEKYLALNTNGGELINTLSNNQAINDAKDDTGIYFEASVKFVPSDTLTDLSDLEGADAKFAIYALAEENGPTNLVVFHKFYDGINYDATTNEVFTSVSLPDDTVTVRVDYKKDTVINEGDYVFKVSINGTALTSGCPFYESGDASQVGEDWACWMQTVNAPASATISSLCFKGTGAVDDIVVDAVAATVEEFEADDEVAGETLSADAATWLNGLYGAGKTYTTYAAYAEALAARTSTLTIEDCSLFDVDPIAGAAEFTVSAISVDENGVTITVSVDRTGAVDAAALGGTLKVLGYEALGGQATLEETISVSSSDFENGDLTREYTIQNLGDEVFFKAEIAR